jgi:hypothetical protein
MRRGVDWDQALPQLDVVLLSQLPGLSQLPEALASEPGAPAYRSAWEQMINAAKDYNDPGEFTAFIGDERTSTSGVEVSARARAYTSPIG